MSNASNLHELQQIEMEIESLESQVASTEAHIKDSQETDEANARLVIAEMHLDELKKRQHSLDWEIEDIGGRVTKENDALYSGRIKNPKELASLQHETDTLKAKKNVLEDTALELMEQLEKAESDVAIGQKEFEKLQAKRQSKKNELSAELDSLKVRLAELKVSREQALTAIGQESLAMYSELKKQKGRAVALVEQGVCRGCGLSLSSAWLQRARAGLVRCTSCGRFLYLE